MSTTETGPDPLSPAERHAVLREHLEREKSRRRTAEAELARTQSAAQTLGKIVSWQAQSMEAARIEMIQSGPGKAMQWILNSITGQWDGNDPDDQWNGTETAREWLDRTQAAYGVRPSVSTHWCIAWGGEDANDCAGRLEYDDEAEAREMTRWIDGGIVARQTVIRLSWENVPDEEPAP